MVCEDLHDSARVGMPKLGHYRQRVVECYTATAGYEVVIVASSRNLLNDIAQTSFLPQIEKGTGHIGQLSSRNQSGIDGRVLICIELSAVIVKLFTSTAVPSEIIRRMIDKTDWRRPIRQRLKIDN